MVTITLMTVLIIMKCIAIITIIFTIFIGSFHYQSIKSRNLVCLKFVKARIVIRMIIFPMKLGNSLKRVDAFSGGHGPTFVLVPRRNS